MVFCFAVGRWTDHKQQLYLTQPCPRVGPWQVCSCPIPVTQWEIRNPIGYGDLRPDDPSVASVRLSDEQTLGRRRRRQKSFRGWEMHEELDVGRTCGSREARNQPTVVPPLQPSPFETCDIRSFARSKLPNWTSTVGFFRTLYWPRQ